jgi:hypothetical protein
MLLPGGAYDALRERHRRRWLEREYGGLSTVEVFSKIYATGSWGRAGDPSQPFFSGTGSHDPLVVERYVQSVVRFLESFDHRPSVVDLGCGDFSVGARIRPHCGSYVACDVVPELVEFNRVKYAALDVDFRVLDLAADPLPSAEVVFVRQVLQHLSNDRLVSAVPKLAANFHLAVVTEHLPSAADFPHNLDKPTGPDTRLRVGSGVVLTSPPFALEPLSARRLCEMPEQDGVVVTTVYEFRPI